MKYNIYITLLCIITLIHAIQLSFAQTVGVFGPQSSNKNIEWDFDFVETFDNLQDWQGNNRMDVTIANYPDDFPKHADGTKSNWEYYSMWVTPSGENWIAFHNSENVLEGSGKSLRIDLGNTGDAPSRVGMYFGDGTPESGYDEIYIFHMVKIPKNEWPTSITGSYPNNIGEYVEGEQYTWYGSWKFGTLNLGMTGPFEFNHIPSPYSPFTIIPHIKKYSYSPIFGLAFVLEPTGGTGSYWSLGKGIEHLLPGWWGVEFHFKNVAEGVENFTYMDVWIYDENGNTWQALDNAKCPYTSQPFSHKWNYWFFGGNNSATYLWGPTMESPYYIDDFIINNIRIGPKYFAIKYGTGLSVPVGGYEQANLIPSQQVNQATDGSGLVTINFKVLDEKDQNLITLSNFEYSKDGLSWSRPINGDNSAALSENWDNNSYLSGKYTIVNGTTNEWNAAPSYSFTFNPKHSDVNDLNNYNGNVQFRFFVNKEDTICCHDPVESEPINLSTAVENYSHESNLATKFVLNQNYPNPFNDSCEIQYFIPKIQNRVNWYFVDLSIFNGNGKLVKRLLREIQGPGAHQIVWNGTDNSGNKVASGTYFYVLNLDKKHKILKKLLYLK